MKVKIKNQFVPFKLVLTVESYEELVGLWKRFNLSGFNLDKITTSYNDVTSPNMAKAWKILDEMLNKFN